MAILYAAITNGGAELILMRIDAEETARMLTRSTILGEKLGPFISTLTEAGIKHKALPLLSKEYNIFSPCNKLLLQVHRRLRLIDIDRINSGLTHEAYGLILPCLLSTSPMDQMYAKEKDRCHDNCATGGRSGPF